MFVDPYLDAEFVSRYLPQIREGVAIRLLTGSRRLSTLLPAVDQFALQSQSAIAVRSTDGLHDRHLIIDRTSCYQSGSSFKDGTRNAPTTLTQLVDVFPAVLDTYERMWQEAKIER